MGLKAGVFQRTPVGWNYAPVAWFQTDVNYKGYAPEKIHNLSAIKIDLLLLACSLCLGVYNGVELWPRTGDRTGGRAAHFG